jgi:hypothetical protein
MKFTPSDGVALSAQWQWDESGDWTHERYLPGFCTFAKPCIHVFFPHWVLAGLFHERDRCGFITFGWDMRRHRREGEGLAYEIEVLFGFSPYRRRTTDDLLGPPIIFLHACWISSYLYTGYAGNVLNKILKWLILRVFQLRKFCGVILTNICYYS